MSADWSRILSLPPWDQIPYHSAPIETAVAATTTNQLLIAGDPNRRTLVIALTPPATGSWVVSTSASGNGTQGIPLSGTFVPLVIGWQDYGPLVCYPWYVSLVPGTVGTATITVISQQLLRADSRPSLIEQVDNANYRAGNRPANGDCVIGYGNTDSGAEPSQKAIDDIAALIQSCQRGPRWQRVGNDWLPPSRWRRPVNPR